MTRSTTAQQRRSQNRKALARKAEVRKTIITKESAGRVATPDRAVTSGPSNPGASTTTPTTTPGPTSASGARSSDGVRSGLGRSTTNSTTAAAATASATGPAPATTATGAASTTGRRSTTAATARSGGAPDGASRTTNVSDPEGDDGGGRRRRQRGRARSRGSVSVIDLDAVGEPSTSALAGLLARVRARTAPVVGVPVAPAPLRRAGAASSTVRSWPWGRRRIGGVAPFVAPRSRAGRLLARRRLERQGFVPLSPGRPRLVHRILPRTVIGISLVVLAFAVGAAFSGAAFYAYYDNRLAENEETVARFIEGFDQQFTDAAGAIDELRVGAVEDIRSELDPLGDYVADANGVITLPATAGPSVWLVETRDEAGRVVGGAGFAVAAHNGGTAFVTSYSLVRSSTSMPAPPLELVKDGRRLPAQLWTWDAEHDVALVVVAEAVPPLELANERRQIEAVGARIFAMSGVGGQGATASPGVLLDRTQAGLQHTAGLGPLFAGGPLLTGDGTVVGVATTGYRPYGIDAGDVHQAPGVGELCVAILACSERLDEFQVEVVGEVAEAPPASTESLRPGGSDTPTEEADEG
ncbi:MAG: trypsin-like peptidase domain-containing protein [Acidimicrobiales bacterium]